MATSRHTMRPGVTLVEVIMASAVALIVFAGIAALLVEGQRGWNAMYRRAYGDVVTDGYVATRLFDALVRKSEGEGFALDEAGSWAEVHYSAGDDSEATDRYARLIAADGQLTLEYGQLEPRATLGTNIVCGNVSACTFKQVGRSIEMILALDDGTQTNEVLSAGYLHN